jgi:hypothetical protein
MEKDDSFIRIYDSYDYEGGDHGHSHSHGEGKEDNNGIHGHSHGSSDEDMKHYNASMSKLKLVSFVSIFFIAA